MMLKEYLLVIISFVFLSMQIIMLGVTLHINNLQSEPKEVVRVEKDVIVEYHYVNLTEKVPTDVIEESEDEIVEEIEEKILPTLVLSESLGRVQGPQEEETYYNLPMDRVVRTMRNMGYEENDYPYYETENGIKMLGDFIMVAADLSKYPRGTIVQTSLGQGMVCDTGEDLSGVIDIAVNW